MFRQPEAELCGEALLRGRIGGTAPGSTVRQNRSEEWQLHPGEGRAHSCPRSPPMVLISGMVPKKVSISFGMAEREAR